MGVCFCRDGMIILKKVNSRMEKWKCLQQINLKIYLQDLLLKWYKKFLMIETISQVKNRKDLP